MSTLAMRNQPDNLAIETVHYLPRDADNRATVFDAGRLSERRKNIRDHLVCARAYRAKTMGFPLNDAMLNEAKYADRP